MERAPESLIAIEMRAREIQEELNQGVERTFDEIIYANKADGHAAHLKPLTFVRQVLSLCLDQSLMDHPCFPGDAKQRAVEILNSCGGKNMGSYCSPLGLLLVRRHIAEFIEHRDGNPSCCEDVFTSSGTSWGLEDFLKLIKGSREGKRSGIMIPVPGHELYFDRLSMLGIHKIDYYLDEDSSWGIKIDELKKGLEKSRTISNPRALVVINPGNPTGAVLSRENMEEVIKFAFNERLLLIADEVYQVNVYREVKFLSFKKVMVEMGEPYKSMELISFMSVSKGHSNECGLRGGYAEMFNFDPVVKDMISKYTISSSTSQVIIDCVLKPPKEGDPSFSTYSKEVAEIRESLEEKVHLMEKLFKRMEGIKYNLISGGFYAFPQLLLPDKAISKAQSLGQEPDYFYAMQLLEKAGICVTPGCKLGQKPGTHHLKISIAVRKDKFFIMLKRLEEFHRNFMEEFK